MKYTFILLIGLMCCQNRNSNGVGDQSTLKGISLVDRMKSKNIYKGDTINFSNFEEYLQFIPEYNFENVSKTPEIEFEISALLNHCNYGPQDGSSPISKIIKDKFVAIIYSLPIQGEAHLLITYNKKGEKIDEKSVYAYEGYDTIDTTYRKVENCECKIDKDLNIHYKHPASILIKNDKSNPNIKDSVLLDDFEEYYAKIDNSGKINEIKK